MDDDIEEIKERLVRVESRLVQLMLHLGLDPHNNQKTHVPTRNSRSYRSGPQGY